MQRMAMDKSCLQEGEKLVLKTALNWTQEGTHKWGRPKNTWQCTVLTKMRGLGHNWSSIQKLVWVRELWKSFVAALCASGHNCQWMTEFVNEFEFIWNLKVLTWRGKDKVQNKGCLYNNTITILNWIFIFHCEITHFWFPPFIKILTDSTIIKTKSQFIWAKNHKFFALVFTLIAFILKIKFWLTNFYIKDHINFVENFDKTL